LDTVVGYDEESIAVVGVGVDEGVSKNDRLCGMIGDLSVDIIGFFMIMPTLGDDNTGAVTSAGS
jgi:hypothetical protein